MAFIIVAAGPMTDCRMRTIAAGPAIACITVTAVLLMSGCLALGYGLARLDDRETAGHDDVPAFDAARRNDVTRAIDLERPEGLVLVDRVGDLSGRLTRLEIEAASLASRVGKASPASEPAGSRPVTTTSVDVAVPRGGPLLPLDVGIASTQDAPHRRARDPGLGLARLETGIARLESAIERMTDIVSDRELSTMAYPNRVPMSGRTPRISSGFGVRSDPLTGRLSRHMGLDIPAAKGTAVLASGGGRVVAAGYRGPYGNTVVIDHGDGLHTLYGHCSKLYVRTGELVMPQQKIAAVGSTGRSTGPHLHFEVIRNGKRVAPGKVLDAVLAGRSG